MPSKVKEFMSTKIVPVAKKPLVGMYEIAKNSLKEFFEGAPGPAFRKRALMGLGSLALFGALMLFVPMGLSMAGVIAVTLLQIPLGIYQKSFMKGLGNAFKKIKTYNSLPLKIIAGSVLLALATGLVVSPAGRTFVLRTLGRVLEKFAIPLLRIPMNRFKKQATRAVQNEDGTETVEELFSSKSQIKLSDEEAESKRKDAVKSLNLMDDDQRQAFFDALRQNFPEEFKTAVARPPTKKTPAPKPAPAATAPRTASAAPQGTS